MNFLTELMLKYTDLMLRIIYSLNKLFVVIAGMYIILMPPFTWVGSLSSGIMVLAGLLSIYGIWANKPDVEFVAIWFVICGVGVYMGFAWPEGSILRGSVASMAFLLLAARGLQLGNLVAQISKVERQSNGR